MGGTEHTPEARRHAHLSGDQSCKGRHACNVGPRRVGEALLQGDLMPKTPSPNLYA